MASGSRGQGPESCKLSRLVIAEAEGAELRASSAVALGSLTVVCTGRGPKGTRVHPCDVLCMTAQMQLLCARMYHGQQPYKVRQMGTASVLQSSGIRDQGLMRGIKGWGVFCHALCPLQCMVCSCRSQSLYLCRRCCCWLLLVVPSLLPAPALVQCCSLGTYIYLPIIRLHARTGSSSSADITARLCPATVPLHCMACPVDAATQRTAGASEGHTMEGCASL